MIIQVQNIRAALGLLAVMLLASCGHREPDFYFVTNDARGAKADTEVIWRGAVIGKVSDVRFQNGQFRIEVSLKDDYRNQIRSDAEAKIANGITTGFKPSVKVVGGVSSSAPMIKRGDRIREAAGVIDADTLKRLLQLSIPEAQQKLEQLADSAVNSPEVRSITESVERELENAAEAARRGQSTVEDARRRITNAINAAMKELGADQKGAPPEKRSTRE